MVHFWTDFGKVKMCLRGGRFFLILKNLFTFFSCLFTIFLDKLPPLKHILASTRLGQICTVSELQFFTLQLKINLLKQVGKICLKKDCLVLDHCTQHFGFNVSKYRVDKTVKYSITCIEQELRFMACMFDDRSRFDFLQ